jgi:folate-binding Fe-S cluster repair protein YgfZ
MSMPAGVDLSGAGGLGVLAFRGADAARFLQGQLSADTEKLAPGASTLAGLHNAQGRVIALLALARAAPDEILAVLPRELGASVAQRLGKYLFRAKVRISDESDVLRVLGVPGGPDRSRWRRDRLGRAPPAAGAAADSSASTPATSPRRGSAPTSRPAFRRSTPPPAKPSWRRC